MSNLPWYVFCFPIQDGIIRQLISRDCALPRYLVGYTYQYEFSAWNDML